MKDPIIQIKKGDEITFEMNLIKLLTEVWILGFLDVPLDETTKLFLNDEEVEKPVEREDDGLMKKIIYIKTTPRYGCPYCGHTSNTLFPIEHYEGGGSGLRTFKCPKCGKEMGE